MQFKTKNEGHAVAVCANYLFAQYMLTSEQRFFLAGMEMLGEYDKKCTTGKTPSMSPNLQQCLRDADSPEAMRRLEANVH